MTEQRRTYHHNHLKEALITQGLHMIHQEGMGALSLRRLAKEVGVSAAACYNHFKNAEELFGAMTDYITLEFTQVMAAAIEENPYGCITISMGCAYVKFFAEYPHYFTLLFDSRDLGISITGDSIKADDSFPPFRVFEEGARKEMQLCQVPEAEFRDNLLAMWSMAHGLAAMANMKGIHYDGDWVELAEKIMKEKVRLK